MFLWGYGSFKKASMFQYYISVRSHTVQHISLLGGGSLHPFEETRYLECFIWTLWNYLLNMCRRSKRGPLEVVAHFIQLKQWQVWLSGLHCVALHRCTETACNASSLFCFLDDQHLQCKLPANVYDYGDAALVNSIWPDFKSFYLCRSKFIYGLYPKKCIFRSWASNFYVQYKIQTWKNEHDSILKRQLEGLLVLLFNGLFKAAHCWSFKSFPKQYEIHWGMIILTVKLVNVSQSLLLKGFSPELTIRYYCTGCWRHFELLKKMKGRNIITLKSPLVKFENKGTIWHFRNYSSNTILWLNNQSCLATQIPLVLKTVWINH